MNATFSWRSFATLFTAPTPGNLYRPVSSSTYWITFVLFGLRPWIFHVESVALHAMCCLLVYWLVLLFLEDERIALGSSALFALHPIHVEAVANIIGRAELLSAGFSLAALVALRSKRSIHGSKKYAWALLFFFLATLSKESGFSAVLLIPFFMEVPEQATVRTRWRYLMVRMIPFVALAAVAIAARWVVLGPKFFVRTPTNGQIHWENPLLHLAAGPDRIVPALKILGDYVRLLVFPFHLSADYSRMPAQLLREVYSLDGLVSIVAVVLFGISVFLQRRERYAVFGAWFFIAFLISSNLIAPAPTIMGDRLAYLPSVGFLVYVVASVSRWLPAVARPMAITMIAAYASRTAMRLPAWYDQEAIVTATLRDAPTSPKAVYNYAIYLLDDKREAEKARPYFLRVLEFFPDHVLSLMCLADIAMEQKHYDEMADWFRRILRVDPTQAKIREQLLQYEVLKERSSSSLQPPCPSGKRA